MDTVIITNAQYVNETFTSNIGCIQATIDGTVMSVPLDKANRHYAEILSQVEAGTLVIADAPTE